LLRKIGNERFKSDAEADTMSLIQSAGLLIFDDLGAEIENQYYVSDFYNLLNSRINAGLPTVISTNLDRTQLKKRYDDRIMSRLTTMEWLIFRGEDIRLNKKYGINP
jgi:DNA replication protein DnaC